MVTKVLSMHTTSRHVCDERQICLPVCLLMPERPSLLQASQLEMQRLWGPRDFQDCFPVEFADSPRLRFCRHRYLSKNES